MKDKQRSVSKETIKKVVHSLVIQRAERAKRQSDLYCDKYVDYLDKYR